jgi:hypothetical protein
MTAAESHFKRDYVEVADAPVTGRIVYLADFQLKEDGKPKFSPSGEPVMGVWIELDCWRSAPTRCGPE